MLINLVSQKLEIVFHYKKASQASEKTAIPRRRHLHAYISQKTHAKNIKLRKSTFKKIQTGKGVKLALKKNKDNIQMIKKHEKVLSITQPENHSNVPLIT